MDRKSGPMKAAELVIWDREDVVSFDLLLLPFEGWKGFVFALKT